MITAILFMKTIFNACSNMPDESTKNTFQELNTLITENNKQVITTMNAFTKQVENEIKEKNPTLLPRYNNIMVAHQEKIKYDENQKDSLFLQVWDQVHLRICLRINAENNASELFNQIDVHCKNLLQFDRELVQELYKISEYSKNIAEKTNEFLVAENASLNTFNKVKRMILKLLC